MEVPEIVETDEKSIWDDWDPLASKANVERVTPGGETKPSKVVVHVKPKKEAVVVEKSIEKKVELDLPKKKVIVLDSGAFIR